MAIKILQTPRGKTACQSPNMTQHSTPPHTRLSCANEGLPVLENIEPSFGVCFPLLSQACEPHNDLRLPDADEGLPVLEEKNGKKGLWLSIVEVGSYYDHVENVYFPVVDDVS